MILPFVRLLAIYAFVILAVTAFFQRDALVTFFTPLPMQASVQTETPAQPAADATFIPMQTTLSQARDAYWSGDLELAEQLYRTLAMQTPTDADAAGELGNILYAQEKFGEAAKFYLLAGQQLIADNQSERAAPLIGVLQSLAPDKADQLRALFTQ